MTFQEQVEEIERIRKLSLEHLKDKNEFGYNECKNHLIKLESKLEGYKLAQKEMLEKIDELKKRIMKTEVEDDGIYARDKICSCGCQKLSHNPTYLNDKEVCKEIDEIFKDLLTQGKEEKI